MSQKKNKGEDVYKRQESSISINQLINNVLINSKNLVDNTSSMKVELDKQWIGVEKSIKLSLIHIWYSKFSSE